MNALQPGARPALGLTTLTALVALSAPASAVTLPNVDCRANPKQVRCAAPVDKRRTAGSVGRGPAFYQGPFDRVVSGYVDEKTNRAIVAVEYGAQQDDLGAILAVDLATGDRTLISGAIDGATRRGAGVTYKNARGQTEEGWDLGFVRAVRPLPNGHVAALVNKGTSSRSEILDVDPATGRRTLLWASDVSDQGNADGLRAIEGDAIKNARCTAQNGRLVVPGTTFEVDESGALYLFAYNNPLGTGTGLLKVQGGTCAFVSGYFPDGTNIAGSGPMILSDSPLFRASARIGNVVYASTGPNPDGNALVAYATSGGARDVVSLKARVNSRSRGAGDGEVGLGSLAPSDIGMLTMGVLGVNDFSPVLVQGAKGDRVTLEAKSGPLATVRDPDGVLIGIPREARFLVFMDGALMVFDARTGNSFVLSY